MSARLLGLHHVTATVDDAQSDLDFCLGVLGLRLVKKTVNFDNHSVYHFYYGDERGTPGTIWTTFPYRGWGVPQGIHGKGQITVTAFSVPRESLAFWRDRLAAHRLDFRELPGRFGEPSLEIRDPSGLVFHLVGGDDPRAPWTAAGIGMENAVRGLHSVTMLVRQSTRTLELMTGVLGWRIVTRAERATRVATGGDGPGHVIDVVDAPEVPVALNGIGTVHHVAMAIGTDEEQLQLREELVALGLAVTEVRDRQYFRSIYFREPGGVLFEVATVTPGFTIDEPLAQLGRELRLPPWEEPERSAIEAALPEVIYA
ncbi:MAG TPA: ring-cleaving dioxygenase [Gemmatimonadales bacterium]|nr:ring-cleaving dioxygenase [Gemmatimonadales bacterium]